MAASQLSCRYGPNVNKISEISCRYVNSSVACTYKSVFPEEYVTAKLKSQLQKLQTYFTFVFSVQSYWETNKKFPVRKVSWKEWSSIQIPIRYFEKNHSMIETGCLGLENVTIFLQLFIKLISFKKIFNIYHDFICKYKFVNIKEFWYHEKLRFKS